MGGEAGIGNGLGTITTQREKRSKSKCRGDSASKQSMAVFIRHIHMHI